MAYARIDEGFDEKHTVPDGNGVLGLQPVAGADLPDVDVAQRRKPKYLVNPEVIAHPRLAAWFAG